MRKELITCRTSSCAGPQAVDEPLYAHHLTQSPHLQKQRPYVQELFRTQSCDGAEVVEKVIMQPLSEDKPVLYLKHMAKQIVNLDLSFIAKVSGPLHACRPARRLMLAGLTCLLGCTDEECASDPGPAEDAHVLGQQAA